MAATVLPALSINSKLSSDNKRGSRDYIVDLTNMLEATETITGGKAVVSDATVAAITQEQVNTVAVGNIGVGKGYQIGVLTLKDTPDLQLPIDIEFVGNSGTRDIEPITIHIISE